MPHPEDVDEDTLEGRDDVLTLSLRVDTVEDTLSVAWVEVFEGVNEVPRARVRVERPKNLGTVNHWVGKSAVLQMRRRGEGRAFRGLVAEIDEPVATTGTVPEAGEISLELASALQTLSPDDLTPRLEGNLEEALTALIDRLRSEQALGFVLRTTRRLRAAVPSFGRETTGIDRLNALCAAGGLHWFVDHDADADQEVVVLSDGREGGRLVDASLRRRGARTVLRSPPGAGPRAVTTHRFESENLQLAAGLRVEGPGLDGSAVVTRLHGTGNAKGEPKWRAFLEAAARDDLTPDVPARGADLRHQPDGVVSLRNSRGVRLESQGCTVTLRDGQVSIESPQEVVLTSGASQIRLTPSGVEVQGTTVKSHSSGLHQTTGLVVKIN